MKEIKSDERAEDAAYEAACEADEGRQAREATDDVARHTTQRLDSFVDNVAGKRLTYKRLIA